MKRFAIAIFLALPLLASGAWAQYQHIDQTVFGMD
jgi:hypothetical protein